MARSSYVYVVQSMAGSVLAGFTVKYEMIDYVQGLRQQRQPPVHCIRVGDGNPRRHKRHAYVYTEKELFGD